MNNKYKSMLRDLKSMGKRLKTILITKHENDREEARVLTLKMKGLIRKLSQEFGVKRVKHALGALAFLFGLSNTVEAQSFAPALTNPYGISAVNYIALPTFVDIDGDGDLDLFVVEYYGNIKYFQNIGTASNPQFASPVDNPFGIITSEYNNFLAFGDIDGDGDKDLIMGGYYGEINFFQNTGSATNPQFAQPQTNPFGLESSMYVSAPTFADLDGDGDLDLLIGSFEYIDLPYYNFKGLRYFKNIGTATSPNFELQSGSSDPFNNITVSYFAYPHLVDLDNDGDFDLIFGEEYGVLKYHQNTGTSTNPIFSSMGLTNPFGLMPGNYLSVIASGDLDNDGDMDLLIGEYNEYYADMKYYRNTTINLSIDDAIPFEFRILPNPATDFIEIQASADVVAQVELLDVNGSIVKTNQDINERLDISDLTHGVYLIKITNQRGDTSVKRLVKQ